MDSVELWFYVMGDPFNRVMRILTSIDDVTDGLIAGLKLYGVTDSFPYACQVSYKIAKMNYGM